MNIQRTLSLVDRLLEEDSQRKKPKLINSDKSLQLAVWREQGLRLTREQEQMFLQAIPASTISRARQQVQGKYPITDETVFSRRAQQAKTALAYGGSRKPSILDGFKARFGLVGQETFGNRLVMVLRRR